MPKYYSFRHSLQNPPCSSTSTGVTTIPQALHLHISRTPVNVFYHILAKYRHHSQSCRVCLEFLLLVTHRIIIHKLLNMHHHLMQNYCPHILTSRITHCLSSPHTNQENPESPHESLACKVQNSPPSKTNTYHDTQTSFLTSSNNMHVCPYI